jgi:hypothetical protein
VTTGQKWLGLLLLQAGLLGGAYGGGRYPEWKKRQAAEETAKKAYEKLEAEAKRIVLVTRARAVLMEAALAARYGNYGMAFERVIRAQSAVQNLKLPLQKEFDDLTMLLIAQKPEVLDKILAVADKIEPPARLVPPELTPPAKPAANMVPAPDAAALPAGPVPGPSPSAAPVPAPAPPRPVPAPAVAAPVSPAPPSLPPRNALPDVSIEQSRSSLLAAKELMISGLEPSQVIPKIAHAQVLLEESGHAEFGEQFATAIKALRAHDEAKARTTLDAVLASLRSL